MTRMATERGITVGKKRILYIMHGLAPGGIEAFALNVLEHIDREKLEISFALATTGRQYHEDRVVNSGSKVYKTSDLDGLRNMAAHFFRLLRLLREQGPFDTVHSHIDFFNGINLLAAFIAGVPVRISHSHNTHSAAAVDRKTPLKVKLYRFVMKGLIRLFSTHRLGCSEAANTYMYGRSWTRDENSRVIKNGIHVERYRHTGCDRTELQKRLGLPEGKLHFLTVGRMSEQKNSLFVVEVMKELMKIRHDVHFTWVGTGRLEKEIRQRVGEYGLESGFTFLGTRTDIPDILAAADLFLFPSLWEGLPVALVEAQAAGVSCFVSDTVTPEADLGLCTVISLQEAEKAWACKINDCITTKAYPVRLEEDKVRQFDIKRTVKALEAIYLGVRTGCIPGGEMSV